MKTTQIILSICVLTLVLNYALHLTIIKQNESIKKSAEKYVQQNCNPHQPKVIIPTNFTQNLSDLHKS